MPRGGGGLYGPVREHQHRPARVGGPVRVLDVGAADHTAEAAVLAVHGAHRRRVDDGFLLDKLEQGAIKLSGPSRSEGGKKIFRPGDGRGNRGERMRTDISAPALGAQLAR